MQHRTSDLSDSLLILFTFITAAANPVQIPPPVWEKWCQARSNQTQTQQVTPIRTLLILREKKDRYLFKTEFNCLCIALIVFLFLFYMTTMEQFLQCT